MTNIQKAAVFVICVLFFLIGFTIGVLLMTGAHDMFPVPHWPEIVEGEIQ